MEGGYVKLHRKLQNHPLWTRERFTRGQAWVDLILSASFREHPVIQGNGTIWVKRGEVLTSQVDLARRWKWNRETVRDFLRLLASDPHNMLAIRTSKTTDSGYTLITLHNYERYQGDRESQASPNPAIDSAIEPGFQPPSSRHPAATVKKGKEGEEGKTKNTGISSTNDNGFDEFWRAYPKKRAKAVARRAWQKNVVPELVPALLNALEDQKRSPDWTKDGGQYIPYPATWLSGQRWEDEEMPTTTRQWTGVQL